MSKCMLRNQAFLRDGLEVISDWRLLTFCSILLLRNNIILTADPAGHKLGSIYILSLSPEFYFQWKRDFKSA